VKEMELLLEPPRERSLPRDAEVGAEAPAPADLVKYASERDLLDGEARLRMRADAEGQWRLTYGTDDYYDSCPQGKDERAWIDDIVCKRREYSRRKPNDPDLIDEMNARALRIWQLEAKALVDPIVRKHQRMMRTTVRGTVPERPRGRGPSREGRRAVTAGRRAARAPTSSDDGPEPPLARVCRGCGCDFETREPRRRSHNDKCKSRTLTAQHRARKSSDSGGGRDADEIVARYRREIFKARRSGRLDGFEALELLIYPSQRIFAMLRAAA
jgi:hypothetical protein